MKKLIKSLFAICVLLGGVVFQVNAAVIWSDGSNKVTNDHPDWLTYYGSATCDLDYVNKDDMRYWSVTVIYHKNYQDKQSVTAKGSWSGPVTRTMTYIDTLDPFAPKTSVGWDYVKTNKDSSPYRVEY